MKLDFQQVGKFLDFKEKSGDLDAQKCAKGTQMNLIK